MPWDAFKWGTPQWETLTWYWTVGLVYMGGKDREAYLYSGAKRVNSIPERGMIFLLSWNVSGEGDICAIKKLASLAWREPLSISSKIISMDLLCITKFRVSKINGMCLLRTA